MQEFINNLRTEYREFLNNNILKRDDSYLLYHIEALNLATREMVDSHFGTEEIEVDDSWMEISDQEVFSRYKVKAYMSGNEVIVYYSLFSDIDESEISFAVSSSFNNPVRVRVVKTTPFRIGIMKSPNLIMYKFKRLVLESKMRSASDLNLAVIPVMGTMDLESDVSCMVAKKTIDLTSVDVSIPEVKAMIVEVVKTLTNANHLDLESIKGVDPEVPNVLNDGDTKLRMSSINTKFGVSATFRIHSELKAVIPLDKLGFDSDVIEELYSSSKLDSGITLACGAVGTGKTHTLNAILIESLKSGIKAMEFSNPPEHRLPIPQVDYGNNMDHLEILISKARRSALSMVVISEMNSRKLAPSIMDLATSNIHILTTTHVGRLHELPYKFKSFLGEDYLDIFTLLNVCVNQRLINQLCLHCKVAVPVENLPENLLRTLKKFGFRNHVYYESKGCYQCSYSFDLKPFGEVINFTPEVVDEVMRLGTAKDISMYLKQMLMKNETALEYRIVREISKGTISPFVLENLKGVG